MNFYRRILLGNNLHLRIRYFRSEYLPLKIQIIYKELVDKIMFKLVVNTLKLNVNSKNP